MIAHCRLVGLVLLALALAAKTQTAQAEQTLVFVTPQGPKKATDKSHVKFTGPMEFPQVRRVDRARHHRFAPDGETAVRRWFPSACRDLPRTTLRRAALLRRLAQAECHGDPEPEFPG